MALEVSRDQEAHQHLLAEVLRLIRRCRNAVVAAGLPGEEEPYLQRDAPTLSPSLGLLALNTTHATRGMCSPPAREARVVGTDPLTEEKAEAWRKRVTGPRSPILQGTKFRSWGRLQAGGPREASSHKMAMPPPPIFEKGLKPGNVGAQRTSLPAPHFLPTAAGGQRLGRWVSLVVQVEDRGSRHVTPPGEARPSLYSDLLLLPPPPPQRGPPPASRPAQGGRIRLQSPPPTEAPD